MKIKDRVELDHHPIVVWFKGKIRREKKIERRGETIRNRGIWNEEGRRKFRDRIGKLEIEKGTVDEEIEEATTRIRWALKEEKEGKDVNCEDGGRRKEKEINIEVAKGNTKKFVKKRRKKKGRE